FSLAVGATSAVGQVSDEIIKATAGWWFLADAATGAGCNLRLTTDETIGGYAVEGKPDCKVGDSPADDLAAWNLGEGQLILIDPLRHVRFRLGEQEYGAWTQEGADGSFVLTPSDEAVAALPLAPRLYGKWT